MTTSSDDHSYELLMRLEAIHDLLDEFDWEQGDRQLALEAIERIVNGGERHD